MKRFLLIFSIILLCCNKNVCNATAIQGGVTYTVDSARNYVQQDQTDYMEITAVTQFEPNKKQKVVYSYNNDGEIIALTVQYPEEPSKAYIYNKRGQLIYVDRYDKPVNVYPHRGYRYDLNGNLNLTSLTVSKNEMFRFSPSGKLIAHSINGIIYDEHGNIIGQGK